MKKILVLYLSFMLISMFGFSQSSNQSLLIKSKWTLISDEFSGIGSHDAMPENSEISFLQSGQWEAKPAFMGVNTGKWSADKNGKITLFIGEYQKAYVNSVTEKELKILIKKSSSRRELTWKAEK